MKAVWQVRWQDLAGGIRYWTAIIGYDPRDRSLKNLIYLLYVMIFFSIWGFAVLTLLADLGAGFLSLANRLAPGVDATWITAAVLLLTAFIKSYQSGIRSPFVFSETDAEIICQTPLDRSQIALAWFLGDWSPSGLVFTTLAIVLRFASLQMVIPGGFKWIFLPDFLLSGLKTACIVLPLHMAVISLTFALGALRLQGDRDNRWLRWIPLGACSLLVLALVGRMEIAHFALQPVLFPLQAAFGFASWLSGLIGVLLLAALGLLALFLSSRRLNLSRAAQESHSRWAAQQLALLGDTHLNKVIKLRRKLGFRHPLSRVPARQGYFSLLWKDYVLTSRALQISTVFAWLGIFGVCVTMLISSDWGTRLWAFVIWAVLIGGRCTESLRSCLAVWPLTRQLPFSIREVLFAECVAPTSAVILISWLAYIISSSLNPHTPVFLIIFLPMAVICIVLAAVFDIFRHCRTIELIAGQVAEPGAGGLLIGLVLAALPILLMFWLVRLFPAPAMLIPISLLGLGLALAGSFGVWNLASSAYNNMI